MWTPERLCIPGKERTDRSAKKAVKRCIVESEVKLKSKSKGRSIVCGKKNQITVGNRSGKKKSRAGIYFYCRRRSTDPRGGQITEKRKEYYQG